MGLTDFYDTTSASTLVEPFWMVYGYGKSVPAARHMNEASARAEAERLARANVGTRFYVLKTSGVAVTSAPVIYTEFR